jgi:chromosome segregation ATPase
VSEPAPRRPGAQTSAQEIERLKSRLAAAEESLHHECARRTAADQALDELRAEAQRLGGELGLLRAQLDLANAAQLQARSAASELDAARKTGFEAREALAQEREALAQERDECEQLRARLERMDQAGRHPAPVPEARRRAIRGRRRRANWIGRFVALLFMLAVIAAIVFVVHTAIDLR